MRIFSNTALMSLAMLVPVAVSAQFLAILTVLSTEPETAKPAQPPARESILRSGLLSAKAARLVRFLPATIV